MGVATTGGAGTGKLSSLFTWVMRFLKGSIVGFKA